MNQKTIDTWMNRLLYLLIVVFLLTSVWRLYSYIQGPAQD
jgi:hypothetical protein